MEIFKLKKPDHAKYQAKVWDKIIEKDIDFSHYLAKANQPEYLFWDKVKYLLRPEELSAEEFWSLVKFSRSTSPRRKTPITDKNGSYFTWQHLSGFDFFFHEIDMRLGGQLETRNIDFESFRQRLITRGIMEESIASSQLEGAATTRKVAKQMILEKRKPRNNSEQMILNNYNAMVQIEEQERSEKLSVEKLLNLHSVLTKDTIDKNEVGRFRNDKDDIVVRDRSTHIIYHVPPNEKTLRTEMEKFTDYANDKTKDKQFVHPVIKAIILHFWIGYLHPFTDGNGRLARLMFYWYLLKNEYWAFAYLPLSKMIKKSPIQYRDAYVYSEQDDNDLTYFVDYNVRKILLAKKDFEQYCKKVETENKKMFKTARLEYKLNDRQIQVLRYLYKNPNATTSIKTHASINNVIRITARKDLEELERLGFLISKKVGRERPFSATRKISELFD